VRHLAIIVVAGLSMIALGGCFPAITRNSPQVSGNLLIDGVPAEAAVVFVQTDANAACNASSMKTVTDASGSFEVPAGHRFEMLSPLSDFRLFNWRLCFEYGGRTFPGFGGVGDMPAPRKVELECRLSLVTQLEMELPAAREIAVCTSPNTSLERTSGG